VQYGRRVSRLIPLLRRYGFDALIVLAALETALELVFRQHEQRAPATTPWLTIPVLVAAILLLLARRRLPFAAPACFWLAGAALSFLDGRLVVFPAGLFAAGMAAALLLGNLRDALQARLGLAIVLGGAAVVVFNDPIHSPGELVFTPVLFGIAWLAGFALRERAEQAEAAEQRASQAERQRETATRLAVAEERARIARELHDIVAHAVSVMVLQVGAVRHRLPEALDQDRGALADVERVGRNALTEMRRLLGAMRREEDDLELAPHPGLGTLEPLLDEVRSAGVPVQLRIEGEPVALPRALDLSAYRIVQEGLTNALKHAAARHVDVTVRYGAGELELEVRDDGNGVAETDGLGHGLVGIRERVKLYGGELSAGPGSDGGFVLSTRLPLERGGR
jgi:signal transduction histidine kinase